MRGVSSFISSTATSELSLAGAPLALRVDKRARRLRLRVDARGGGLVLTVPAGMSQKRALQWAETHSGWAEQALKKMPEPMTLGAGGSVEFRGEMLGIAWDSAWPRRVARVENVLRVGGPGEAVAGRVLRWMKAEALRLLTAETREIAAIAGRKVARVGIGDPRSRWGSCSSGGAIRYSWRLIMAPDFVRRATVAHEVAHLVHMDHSPRFHAVVRELLGADPGPAREWLRRNGASLNRVAR